MIYYFSGTGNSLIVARQLAERLGDELAAMTSPQPLGEGAVGLVFPVYAWGIPNVVEMFARTQLRGCEGRYVYAVMTCGDDVGYTDKVLERSLPVTLDAAFSVQMPNTYVCLPGFDVDKPAVSAAKLEKMPKTVENIAEKILQRQRTRLLVRGGMPWLKTYVLRPLFNRFLLTDKYFRVDASRCVSCGKCRKACPLCNIDITSGLPLWQHHCSGCLGCYHACPQHAIDFGGMTKEKGQSYHLRQP